MMRKSSIKSIKKSITTLWLCIAIVCFWYYITHLDVFTAENISDFFLLFGEWFLVVYFIISILRWFTLIPSTPFVLTGILLFPEELLYVYIISVSGILLSATMIYFFSHEMDFEKMILWKHKKLIEKWEYFIQRYGFYTVTIWSFLIFVPTDIICYVAWSMKMPYRRFILAVAIWEGIICIPLIWWWDVIITNIVNIFLS